MARLLSSRKDQRLISTGRVAGMECVSNLILQNPNRWNRDLIYSNFIVEETDQIVSLLIPITNQSDNVVWSSENSSIYPVKSGYNLVRSVVIAEATAVLHGLQFALDLGFTKVILEKGNVAAHAMVVKGLQKHNDSFWVEYVPMKVLEMADSDKRFSRPP
ncbi:hypothetical protein Golob_012611 [Gossypium lobatum]|uniref:RNase H type-1 domain-containing protein n=1 Tax=Gossypium lobatum TaxID=34289 RepID=A0A7J8LLW6_9ROSI|nr:hypothetical protein [Gossypium lobatum]